MPVIGPTMVACWYFHRFDYARYLIARPFLRAATTPAAFAAVADSAETRAIADALAENTLAVPAARNAFVQALCCRGDPLPLERGFLRVVTALAQRPEAEEAAELLRGLLIGGKNLEPWLLPACGLAGFLTPEETARLHQVCQNLDWTRVLAGNGEKRRRIRRGGLVKAIVRFVRFLFDYEPLPEEALRLLGELIAEAVAQGEGLAVVAA